MTTIYVDGACKGNNTKDVTVRKAGVGIYVDRNADEVPRALPKLLCAENTSDFYHSFTLHGTKEYALSNNRAELEAVIKTLEMLIDGVIAVDKYKKLTIINDSQLVHSTILLWLPGWRKRGYRKAGGKSVENRDLVMDLDALLCEAPPDIEWLHTNSHTKEPVDKASREWRVWHGNKAADRLADAACYGK